MTPETKKQIATRLKRIAGQIGGIQRMVEEERYCVDVLLQVAASKAALDRVGQIVLGSHVDTCVDTALSSGTKRERKEKIDELMHGFTRFGGIRARG